MLSTKVKNLHDACALGDEASFFALLDAGVPLDQKSQNGRTVLHVLVQKDTPHHSVTVMFADALLQRGLDINIAGGSGMTPLHLAVAQGKERMVSFLIDRGASLDLKNKAGQTALHLAIMHGFKSVSEMLIEAGAKLNEPRQDGFFPMHLAINRGWVDIMALIAKHDDKAVYRRASGSGTTCLELACQKGDPAVIDFLVENGAPLNLGEEKSALGLAITYGNVHLCDVAIRHGADVHVRNQVGKSLLHQAVDGSTRASDIVKLLIAAGADVNAKTMAGVTPLHQAAESVNGVLVSIGMSIEEDLQNIMTLIDCGADTRAKNNEGDTFLDILQKRGGEDYVSVVEGFVRSREAREALMGVLDGSKARLLELRS